MIFNLIVIILLGDLYQERMTLNGVIFLGFAITKTIEKLNNLCTTIFMHRLAKSIALWNYLNRFMFRLFFYEKDNELNDILEHFKYDDYYSLIDYFDVTDFHLTTTEVYKKKSPRSVLCYNF